MTRFESTRSGASIVRNVMVAIAVSVSIVACAHQKPTHAPPVDLTIAPIASRLPDTAMNEEGRVKRCELRLRVWHIEKSSPSCHLDGHIDDGPGILRYPCGGNGLAEAEFGEDRYVGRMTDGELELEFQTELDWEDGCRWGTTAVIGGRVVADGEPAVRTLKWRYADRVLSGNDCSGACTANASVVVSKMKSSEDDDEDDLVEKEETGRY